MMEEQEIIAREFGGWSLEQHWEWMWDGLKAVPRTGLFETMLARWSESHRHYHTVEHLDHCLRSFSSLREYAENKYEVAFAIWYHDAIYAVDRHDNEQRSAELAAATLTKSGVAEDVSHRVYELVMSTSHRHPIKKIDEAVLSDCDLAILGETPERFLQYEQQIRKEYAHVQEDHYRTARAGLLQSFLDRPFIYRTPKFRTMREAAARENIQQSIAALTGRMNVRIVP